MNQNMKNVAIYYRVSTEMQEFASQKHEVERWLATQETQPEKITVYEDFAKSGKRNDRAGFIKLMKAAADKKFDTLIVYKLDRLSRDAKTAIKLVMELDTQGIAFVSVTQQVLDLRSTTPFKLVILAVFAEIAQMERENIVARVKSGLAAAVKRGVKLGAPKKLTSDRLKNIYDLRKDGLTIKKIAATLNLSVGTIHRALLNLGYSNESSALPANSAINTIKTS